MSETAPSCAVVYNPVKISEEFRLLVHDRLPADWAEPLWLETTEDDPGRAMTDRAVVAGVDLVIAAGGDGTVRVVADRLAGTGIPLGVVAAGTGNLLARNLGLPLDEAEAIRVAFRRETRTIDLIKLDGGDRDGQHFAVMAGIGIDAMIMDNVDPRLKKTLGPAAYVIAARKAAEQLPMKVTIEVDGHRPRRRRAALCAIGNVGQLPGGITLIPGAKPDDGLLDVYVAAPRRLTHWIKVLARLITRRPRDDDTVDQWQARRVEIRTRNPEMLQLDGDVVGPTRLITAEIRPAALTVCV
ncbi:diacylglycerol/lipid kinase family protein [Microlunatus sp. GCM10028923]|uniref:diacylglycerol/lipid kinase family protein n=1 Tax=Microlunatus sp. GCM10028923 TaxID=3273400 RepID=UPI0036166C12